MELGEEGHAGGEPGARNRPQDVPHGTGNSRRSVYRHSSMQHFLSAALIRVQHAQHITGDHSK